MSISLLSTVAAASVGLLIYLVSNAIAQRQLMAVKRRTRACSPRDN